MEPLLYGSKEFPFFENQVAHHWIQLVILILGHRTSTLATFVQSRKPLDLS